MDWVGDARRDMLDSLSDLRDAEIVLPTLPVGSRDYVLLARAVDRLGRAAGDSIRNEAARAALFDAAALAVTTVGEYRSTYEGPARAEYLRALGRHLGSLGGGLEESPGGLLAAFESRRITIRFGPVNGHR